MITLCPIRRELTEMSMETNPEMHTKFLFRLYSHLWLIWACWRIKDSECILHPIYSSSLRLSQSFRAYWTQASSIVFFFDIDEFDFLSSTVNCVDTMCILQLIEVIWKVHVSQFAIFFWTLGDIQQSLTMHYLKLIQLSVQREPKKPCDDIEIVLHA